jgi:hypothetical protein
LTLYLSTPSTRLETAGLLLFIRQVEQQLAAAFPYAAIHALRMKEKAHGSWQEGYSFMLSIREDLTIQSQDHVTNEYKIVAEVVQMPPSRWHDT